MRRREGRRTARIAEARIVGSGSGGGGVVWCGFGGGGEEIMEGLVLRWRVVWVERLGGR